MKRKKTVVQKVLFRFVKQAVSIARKRTDAAVMHYLTALAWCDLRGHLDYVERNLIEKWFQTLAMRINRFHQTWIERRVSAQRWLTAFVHYYNRQRPNQALDNRTPSKK